MIYDLAVIGGGIVGLATAMAVQEKYPHLRLTVIEKEKDWGTHQTGHNSGVIHSGIYYKPGSLKATLAKTGGAAMVAFCQKHGIPYETCGKLIVATDPEELERLTQLYQRGLANGIPLSQLSPVQAKEIEPRLTCLGAIHVLSTGITDYHKVARQMAQLLQSSGILLYASTRVTAIKDQGSTYLLETTQEPVECRFLVNCGGLYSDRLAHMGGVRPQARIVPFRGEYYELIPEKRSWVRHLIYPVPDPELPFLGVHFTRMIHGGVEVGPNAVLSLKREGYHKMDFSWRDALETLTYPGFWKLARRYSKTGIYEFFRSFSKTATVRSLQRMIRL